MGIRQILCTGFESVVRLTVCHEELCRLKRVSKRSKKYETAVYNALKTVSDGQNEKGSDGTLREEKKRDSAAAV
jgi:hypothetical protein